MKEILFWWLPVARAGFSTRADREARAVSLECMCAYEAQFRDVYVMPVNEVPEEVNGMTEGYGGTWPMNDEREPRDGK